MSDQAVATTQNERALAALSHASIVLGLFTSGLGGIITALVIWLLQKEKSAYVAFQALQALVYQLATFLLTMFAWCCWGLLWMLLILVPLSANPGAYDSAPPAGMWVGMLLMVVPLGIWAVTIVYALWGAVRSLGGHDFKYVLIGNWIKTV